MHAIQLYYVIHLKNTGKKRTHWARACRIHFAGLGCCVAAEPALVTFCSLQEYKKDTFSLSILIDLLYVVLSASVSYFAVNLLSAT